MPVDAGACVPVPWTLTPVDEEHGADDAVLAIDRAGAVHFAYSADTGAAYEIRHAVGAPGAWDLDTIPREASGRDDPLDLAVVGATPHIVFRERRARDSFLVHASRADGGWTTTDIERLGGDPSLAVDAEGTLHVAYVYFSGWQLRYARREPDGSWNLAMLAAADDPERWPSLAAAPDGTLHLGFGAGDSLWYAAAFTETWAPATVEPTWVTTRTSLAIDGAGGAHLFYGSRDTMLPSLVHGYLPAGGAWAASPIDPGDEAVYWPGDLALDSSGGAHIVYIRVEPGIGMAAIRYGHRPAGGTWTTEEALAAPAPGRSRSIAVDASGGIHLAVFGPGGVHHAYMRRCPASP